MLKEKNKGNVWIPIVITILIVFIIIGLYVSSYNKVIRLDESVRSQWAQVENQLKRRYDLIPNLVETVKGYASHEEELFKHIAEARKAYFSAQHIADKVEASKSLEGFLSRLLVLTENYPDLKASESFLKLHDSLEGTENRIAVERMRYNEAVRDLNTYIRSIFGSYFAKRVGVEKALYYDLPEKETETPKVSF